jgi:cation diffusion facilitator CzcD-associated flavoprotein CzcO
VSKNGLPFDPDALREKYREERDKRLRPDGIEQYEAIEGAFSHFENDPYVEPGFTREPLTDEVDVAIIGGGFGGLLAGARLRQQGVQDIRIIEKGGDIGGTWYWNRYPGIACDIESYVYLPLLEELDYVPVEKYSRGSEIFAHCKAIAEKYDLYRNACLQTEVTEIRWDEGISRWIISTNHADAMRARFVCLANGFLQKAKLPGIPGIESFGGHSFHTSRWDYAYTGGDEHGNLDGLRDNRPTDPEWTRSLEPGWHKKRIDNFQILTAGGYQEEDLVADGWTEVIRKILTLMLANEDPDVSPEAIAETVEIADFMQMEEIRARVDAIVEDPATAEALKPWYRQFCKRPCFHDEYLQTFNRSNVTLVDTQGQGVECVTEKGVVVLGEEYALDCLIFATGFEVSTDYSHRAGYQIVGREGLSLTEKWRGGIRTLHGMHIHGFPNCFMMSIAQSGFTVNFPYILDLQARHIAHIAARALEEGIGVLEVSEQAEAEWVDTIIALGGRTIEFSENCTPGYYNNEGQADAKSRQGGFHFGGPTEFADTLEAWRADGSLQGLERR